METPLMIPSTTPVAPVELPTGGNSARAHDPSHRHLSTGHLLTNLRGRTVASGLITAVAQVTQLALNLASIAVLARLLTPRDFGLMAMVTAIMGFLRVFKEAGLSTATVQREGITQAQVSNLFWINVAVSGVVSLVLAAAAPLIAWFYREPRLVGITLALSLTFVLTGSTVQHMALLNRQMRFKVVALIQLGSLGSGIAVGILMAWLKYGPWSLVGMNLTTAIMGCVLTWTLSRWRPQLPARRSGTRPLLSFGVNMAASGFIYTLAQGTDGLLIGRFYGSDALGLYSRGAALLTRPLEQCFSTLNTVFVPALSRLQDQPERYRRAFLQAYEAIGLVSFPFTALFLALARPITLVVLGPKWEKAAIIFASFTLVALFFPLYNVSSWLFSTQGRGRDSLVSSSIASFVMVSAFVAGLHYGPVGVALSYSSCCLLIQLPVRYFLAGRRGPVTTANLWMGFIRCLPLWGVVWGATTAVRMLLAANSSLTQVIICAPAGLLAGAAFVYLWPPLRQRASGLLEAVRDLKRLRRQAQG
jgi:O-antigen/teichoic acid export membrane protein